MSAPLKTRRHTHKLSRSKAFLISSKQQESRPTRKSIGAFTLDSIRDRFEPRSLLLVLHVNCSCFASYVILLFCCVCFFQFLLAR